MKIKEIVTVIAIGVLLALFVGLLVDAVYEGPEYEHFCRESRYRYEKPQPIYDSNASCPDPWKDERARLCSKERGNPLFERDTSGCQAFTACDYCERDFQNAQRVYSRNIFFIISPLAIVAILVGLLMALQFIGSGLILGGILLLIYSTARYFSDMSKVIRVIVIFIELAIVVFLAFKKLERTRKP